MDSFALTRTIVQQPEYWQEQRQCMSSLLDIAVESEFGNINPSS